MRHECTSPHLSDASRSECGGPDSPASATAARERGAPAPHCAPMPGVSYRISTVGQSSPARSAAPSAHAQVWAQCTRQRVCPVRCGRQLRECRSPSNGSFPCGAGSPRSRGVCAGRHRAQDTGIRVSALPGRMRPFIRFSSAILPLERLWNRTEKKETIQSDRLKAVVLTKGTSEKLDNLENLCQCGNIVPAKLPANMEMRRFFRIGRLVRRSFSEIP